ncbi:MAG: hypothetical protein LAP87_20885 [Acidobacteriia bacterium]|nr:hypothetical protein [Terriglobia bacterium]
MFKVQGEAGSRMTGFGALSAVLLGIVSVASPALMASDDNGTPTLRGIKAMSVVVENINPDAVRDGLTADQLKTDVELRLRRVGIKVSESAVPYLYVRVTVVRGAVNQSQYAYSCRVVFEQPVTVKANGVLTLVPTWSTGNIALVGSQRMSREVRDDVGDQVDEFSNAFLSVNPK